MKAADISDESVLKLLDRDKMTFMWELKAAFPLVPQKVLTAKLRKMIKRRRIEGCVCGCRGDFTLPPTT